MVSPIKPLAQTLEQPRGLEDRHHRDRTLTYTYSLADRAMGLVTLPTPDSSPYSSSLASLKMLCIRALLSPPDPELPGYIQGLPSHIRALIARVGAIERPLHADELEAIQAGKGDDAPGEVILVGHGSEQAVHLGVSSSSATRFLRRFVTPDTDVTSVSSSWDAEDDRADLSPNLKIATQLRPPATPLRSLVLYDLPLPPIDIISHLPSTITHLGLLFLKRPHSAPSNSVALTYAQLSALSLSIPGLISLDLSADQQSPSRLALIRVFLWQEHWIQLKTLAMRDCGINSEGMRASLRAEVNDQRAGRWIDILFE